MKGAKLSGRTGKGSWGGDSVRLPCLEGEGMALEVNVKAAAW